MRIFDNPNHPHYGPVRRLWVVLAQLDLLAVAEEWSDRQAVSGSGWRWDQWLAEFLDENPDVGEARFQRHLLRQMLKGCLI